MTSVFIAIIIFITIVSLAGILSDHINKQSKLKLEVLKQEIKLEKIRNEGHIAETEKLRLEIEQTRQQLTLDHPKEFKLE
ncbi:hypothetical protein LG296_07775 [Ureibacillus chungkukjangi]|uniref:Uncharacterized protein n=1 Tax=Ureibacillus chungkukjangi TaxID=1202712 RepID=A0A318TE22_9BACL|nr:hypothetical protein [Ureibacillus chungkukjangi]MCM3389067.1 hypothetical protein [Ureibacillus chungkukjangi]PYF02823.1 hypothetical protein BJ095_13714 [Ureibacillus chungkukjangi]